MYKELYILDTPTTVGVIKAQTKSSGEIPSIYFKLIENLPDSGTGSKGFVETILKKSRRDG